MAGELVPLVLLPRFSSYVGDTTFTTIAMDVTDYQSAIINVWRGPMTGTTPTYDISFQESTDQDNWTTCTNGTGGDPGANTEAQYTPTLAKRWFRAKIVLTGTDPAVSCWAVGFLELRQS
ncbi:MAG: hypothetical protein AB7T63_00305 [Planctomycetota bacterium]